MMIAEIYEKLMIPPNLQEHLLRVAAVMEIMAENWQGPPINKRVLVLVGLGHDLANILKFDFNQSEMLGVEAERVDYWRVVQSEVANKYGRKIHTATLLMAKEMGLDNETIRIIDDLDWNKTETVIGKQDWPVMLAIYADMRIGPMGMLSLDERIDNLNQRRPMAEYTEIRRQAIKLEAALQSKIEIPLDRIINQDLNARFDRLRKMAW